MEQLVACQLHKLKVVGSSPTSAIRETIGDPAPSGMVETTVEVRKLYTYHVVVTLRTLFSRCNDAKGDRYG